MFFLFRMAFWFSLVLLFLPIWPQGEQGSEPVGAFRTLLAAQEAVSDLAGICERKPDVCETGAKAIETITVRAMESARIAGALLNDSETAGQSDAAPTATPPESIPAKPGAFDAVPGNAPIPPAR